MLPISYGRFASTFTGLSVTLGIKLDDAEMLINLVKPLPGGRLHFVTMADHFSLQFPHRIFQFLLRVSGHRRARRHNLAHHFDNLPEAFSDSYATTHLQEEVKPIVERSLIRMLPGCPGDDHVVF